MSTNIQGSLTGAVGAVASAAATAVDIKKAAEEKEQAETLELQRRATAAKSYYEGLDAVNTQVGSDLAGANEKKKEAAKKVNDLKAQIKADEEFIGPRTPEAQAEVESRPEELKQAKKDRREASNIANQVFKYANQRVNDYVESFANKRLLAYARNEITYKDLLRQNATDWTEAVKQPQSLEWVKAGRHFEQVPKENN